MRNAQKQEVLGCIESLHQAHEEIKKALSGGNYSLAQNMLGQCQEFAVSLGENIEKLDGEGHAAVACLEGYCETLYHVYEELESGNAGSGKIYKKLRRQLLRVESSARNDIKARKEVVFLPYKASMWDSLESVWKAADEDPDCDAYVIPIPYYDKNPDGSFREKHYEGEQYPEYVPVVSYESYDFEKRRPDIIFIHNPYDDYNHVTSVDSFFYSKNLKQFTEKLVYIPYFILGEIKPDDRQAVEEMKHFCVVPGVMNADKVIVQSEDMRQVYVNVLAEAAGKQTRGYWEEKVLGIGSPKTDKVLKTQKENLVVPDEWLKIIEKPDGSWKRIVFYNTSVSALLQNGEKMLGKMRDVLHAFKENRDEVTLLWRPHPLIKATIESMRPYLWREYKEIVDRYLEEGWGIYDDTADIDRAVGMSNAYYGDRSSVTVLVEQCQKYVLLQRTEVRNGKGNFARFTSILKINEKMLACSSECNALYEIDLENGEICFVESFMDEDFDQTNMCCGAIKKGNEIIFFPCFGKKIHILNASDYHEIKTLSFRSFEDDEKALLFAGEYEEKVYLVTYDMQSMYVYDIDTHNIKKIIIGIKTTDAFFPKSAFVKQGKIYIVGRKFPFIICIDLVNGESTVQKVSGEKEGFEGIVVNDNIFYLLPSEKKYIISFTGEKIEYYTIREPIRDMAGSIVKDGCWLIGNTGSKELIVFDFTRKQVKYKAMPEELHWGNQANKECHYCFMYGKNHFGYYVDDNMERIMNLSLKSESALQMFDNFVLNSNSALREINEGITLKTLLAYLGHHSNCDETNMVPDLCGKKIYQAVSMNERIYC